MSRLPQVRARELIRALQALGFELIRQRGSHVFLRNDRTRRSTIVPVHPTEDIDRGLLFAILREAGVTMEEFLDVL